MIVYFVPVVVSVSAMSKQESHIVMVSLPVHRLLNEISSQMEGLSNVAYTVK